jgi:hypothetical protein
VTSRHFVERGVERVSIETCRQCALREILSARLHVCLNEHSDHYGHVLTAHHPACGAIQYLREKPCTDLRNTQRKSGGGV